MSKKIDLLKGGMKGLVLGVIAFFAGIAALFLFLATKEAEFTKQMIETYHQDQYVVWSLAAGIGLSGIAAVCSLKFLKYMGFIAYLFALLNAVVFEIDYLGSLFSSIDPTELTSDFVMLMALLTASTVAALLSAILTKEQGLEAGGNEA